MPNPRLASRYAKSLIDLSIEKDQLEVTFADIQWLFKATKSNAEFVRFLRSPIIKADKKRKIASAILNNNVGEITSAFIRLLITKGRESNLPEIITAFIDLYKKYKSIHIVKLTTALPIEEKLKNEIIDQVRKSSNIQNVELQTFVKEDLIGGFILQTGDKLVDASIAYDLREVTKQFENNDFIYKIR